MNALLAQHTLWTCQFGFPHRRELLLLDDILLFISFITLHFLQSCKKNCKKNKSAKGFIYVSLSHFFPLISRYTKRPTPPAATEPTTITTSQHHPPPPLLTLPTWLFVVRKFIKQRRGYMDCSCTRSPPETPIAAGGLEDIVSRIEGQNQQISQLQQLYTSSRPRSKGC